MCVPQGGPCYLHHHPPLLSSQDCFKRPWLPFIASPLRLQPAAVAIFRRQTAKNSHKLFGVASHELTLSMSGLAPVPRRVQKQGGSSGVSRFRHSQRQRRQQYAGSFRHPSASAMTIFCSHCNRLLQSEMSCLPRRGKQVPSASKPFR